MFSFIHILELLIEMSGFQLFIISFIFHHSKQDHQDYPKADRSCYHQLAEKLDGAGFDACKF